MIVFISSPYASILENFEDKEKSRELVFKHARAGARKILEMGHIPFSPVLAFEGVYDEKTQRELAISDSLSMLRRCDGVLFVRSEFSPFSAGMVLEEEWAKKLQKQIFELQMSAEPSENSLN